MADKFDLALEMALHHLNTTYTVLRGVARLLPVPVLLPLVDQDRPIALVVDAVARLAELHNSEPMPEEQQEYLYNGCVMWIAAVDLINVAIVFNDGGGKGLLRLMATTNVLFDTDNSLLALHDWLQDNE